MAVIETVTFRLTPGTEEAAFLAADRLVQTEFTYQQPGLVRRTTARGPDDGWIVVVIWQTAGDADAAAARAGDHPAHAGFAGLLDETTVQRRRYETLD
jgi:hypothetical protein